MSDAAFILQFNRAMLCPPRQPEETLCEVSFALGPGGAAVVKTETDNRMGEVEYCPLADAAQGLLLCGPGEVCFLGQDWASRTPLEQARARGRIGRVFAFNGWVHNLNVMENLTLAGRMHGRRPARELEAAAVTLAGRLGLEGVPAARPDAVRKGILRRLEWVRAFLGEPALVIVERPEAGVPRDALDALFETAAESGSRGAALLWITQDDEVRERAVRLGAADYTARGRNWCRREEKER